MGGRYNPVRRKTTLAEWKGVLALAYLGERAERVSPRGPVGGT